MPAFINICFCHESYSHSRFGFSSGAAAILFDVARPTLWLTIWGEGQRAIRSMPISARKYVRSSPTIRYKTRSDDTLGTRNY